MLQREYNKGLKRFVDGEYSFPSAEMAARATAGLQRQLETLRGIIEMEYSEYLELASDGK